MLTKLGELSFKEAVALDKVPGIISWTKFGSGRVNTSQTTVFTGVDRGKVYTYLDDTSKIQVSSSSSDDTVGGNGARYVRVFGLSEDFEDQNELITMNGQTPVESSLNYTRIYRMRVEDLSGHNAAGNIFASKSGSALSSGSSDDPLAEIVAELNQTQMAMYTVPTGYSLFITNMIFNSMKDKEIELWLVSRTLNSSKEVENPVFTIKSNWGLYRNSISIDLLSNDLVFPEKTEFEVRAKVLTSGSEWVYSAMYGALIPNSYM